ncbi:MAG: hypothetical protein GX174_12135 [Lentisphaerae bacterium]|jgi:hypothetical protein|nr:hypothetical protein [Lentisphaerota bacterium]
MAETPEAVMTGSDWQQIGPYRGQVFDAARYPQLAEALATLGTRLDEGPAELLQGGRHQTFRLDLVCGGETLDVVVKRFGRQSALKDCWDAMHGSKAARTYRTAAFLTRHNVGTTYPLAVLERWQGRRLVESCFVSRYLADTTSFKDLLLAAFYEDATGVAPLDALLAQVAHAVRRMHDAGCRHRDLGNQNIMLCGVSPSAPAGSDVAFLDLNRARCGRPLSGWGRAGDLSRITLPSGLLARFLDHYGKDATPSWVRWLEGWRRSTFALHTLTRFLRHPLRERRYRRLAGSRDAPQHAVYPRSRDYWIWDAAAGAPQMAVAPWEIRLRTPPLRTAYRRVAHATAILRAAAACGAATTEEDTPRLPGCEGVIAVGGTGADFRQTAPFVRELAPRQVLLRFYLHEDEAALQQRLDVAQAWAGEGYALAAGLVQSRAAVNAPERWAGFCERVVAALPPRIEWIEVGYAVDEVRWGIWCFDEYRRMMAPLAEVAGRHPHIVFAGPSVALAPCPALAGALRQWPADMRAGAIALRVPEDVGAISDKGIIRRLARASAVARGLSPHCAGDRIILSTRNPSSPAAFRWLTVGIESGCVARAVIETDLTIPANREALHDCWRTLAPARV